MSRPAVYPYYLGACRLLTSLQIQNWRRILSSQSNKSPQNGRGVVFQDGEEDWFSRGFVELGTRRYDTAQSRLVCAVRAEHQSGDIGHHRVPTLLLSFLSVYTGRISFLSTAFHFVKRIFRYTRVHGK